MVRLYILAKTYFVYHRQIVFDKNAQYAKTNNSKIYFYFKIILLMILIYSFSVNTSFPANR